MRGKVALFERTPHELRITPAYAGKSAQVRQCQGSSRDHPRLCGEKTLNRKGQTRNLGSPPPMRGKVHLCSAVVCSGRITPAYAGKRGRCLQILQEQEDHPRLCGEKTENRQTPAAQTGSPPPMRGKAATRQQRKVKKIGSPPPMRGKVPIHDTVFFHVGITPAYAGKSMELSSNIMVSKDHPRLCGEKASTKAWELWGTGSPPPMRGKVGHE